MCDPEESCDGWAHAHNYLFEDRLSVDRRRDYEAHCSAMGVSTAGDWLAAHASFVQRTIKVAKPFVPETFRSVNAPAVATVASDVVTLRCEDLTRALSDHGCTLDELRDWLLVRDGGLRSNLKPAYVRSKLRDFLDDWNGQRKHWPAFAAFEHELGDAQRLAHTDWPHAIRDRLGMAHYDGSPERPVALMRVPAADIFAAARSHTAAGFTRPTVLDGETNRYFFPTPSGFPFGATVHLDPIGSGLPMTAEILCFPVDYEVDHLVAAGTINRPPPAHCLRNLRNAHLLGLHNEPGGTGFGEIIGANDCHGGAPCR